jgi:hypothetical protein
MTAIKITGITNEDLVGKSDYQPIPAGSYNASVFDVKLEQVKSGPNEGKPRFNVQFSVQDEPYANRRVFSYVPLYKANDFWKAQSFFKALGYDLKAGEFTVPEPTELAGKLIGVRVKIGADQEGRPKNEVAGFDKATTVSGVDNLLASGLVAPDTGDLW